MDPSTTHPDPSHSANSPVLFSFGLIADAQYADLVRLALFCMEPGAAPVCGSLWGACLVFVNPPSRPCFTTVLLVA